MHTFDKISLFVRFDLLYTSDENIDEQIYIIIWILIKWLELVHCLVWIDLWMTQKFHNEMNQI